MHPYAVIDVAVKFHDRPLIGCCGKPAQQIVGNGICSVRRVPIDMYSANLSYHSRTFSFRLCTR